MRSKDTEFAAVKLPRCLVCGGAKVEWGRHSSEHTNRQTVQAHVEEDRTGSRFTYAESDNKIYRRASSEQRPRTRCCHESERLV